jgi:uncharacterized protein YcnI
MSVTRGAALALGLLAAGPAAAHVTLDVQQAPANSTYRAVFRVPHGCEAAATVRFIVQLPEGFAQARPMPKPGWTLRVTYRGEPASGHGAIADASEIVWEGGRLPNEHYDEFVVRLRLPNRPNELIYIPVVQECEDGSRAAWVEVPAPGTRVTSLRYPAPAIRLAPAN